MLMRGQQYWWRKLQVRKMTLDSVIMALQPAGSSISSSYLELSQHFDGVSDIDFMTHTIEYAGSQAAGQGQAIERSEKESTGTL